MAFREISVPLKFPGTAGELSKLGNTVLEGVVYGIYKDVLLGGQEEYEIEAVVFILRGNLMLSFTPQFAGMHTARIFSDGREICKPVVFRITPEGQAVRADGVAKRGPSIRSNTLKTSVSTTFTDDGSEEASVFTQNSATLSRYARSDTEVLKARSTKRMDSGINLLSTTGMPVAIPEEGTSLASPIHQHLTTFNYLYSQKFAGVKFAEADIKATKKEVLHATLGPGRMLTMETMKLLKKDATSEMRKP